MNLFFYSAQLWDQKIGKPCSIEEAITLHAKYVCKNHFLDRNFTMPEKKRHGWQLSSAYDPPRIVMPEKE